MSCEEKQTPHQTSSLMRRTSGTILLLLRSLVVVTLLLAGDLSAAQTPSPTPGVRETSFTRLLPLDEVLVSGVDVLSLSDEPKRSRTECGQQCATTKGCVTYTFFYPLVDQAYNSNDDDDTSPPPSRKCRLFGRVPYLTCSSWVQAPGARTFRLHSSSAWAPTVSCPPGYELQCGRCLAAVTEELVQPDAQQRCIDMDGGRLAVIKTLDDMDCVRNFAMAKGLDYPWLGADDSAVPGQFQWNDGTSLANDSPLWASGEPASGHPGSDCAYLGKQSWELYTDRCAAPDVFVCEKYCM